MRIPSKPHSQIGMITSAVDLDYFIANLKSFDPYGVIIGGTSTLWDLVMYLAQVNGVDVKDEKEMTATEITAGKIYPAILMSYLQALRAQKNIIDLCPIFVANVSTSDGIFTIDEWWNELNNCAHGKYPSVIGIENFIHRINPIWKHVYEYPMLNFPGAHYVQWVPNKTTAEMRALRVLMGTYGEAYQTFCNKAKISTSVLDAAKFVNREVATFTPFSFSDKDWLFWNASGGYIDIQNGANTASNLMTARKKGTGEIFDVVTASWLSARDKYYIIPIDGEPSDLNAIIQMLYPHHANNLLGAVTPDDGGGLNDDTLRAADIWGANLTRSDPGSTNDTVAVATDRAYIGKIFPNFPAIFAGQDLAEAAMVKVTEEAGETAQLQEIYLTGGLRRLDYDTNIWDNANGLLVQSFFQEVFGKASAGVTQITPKYNRPARKYNQPAGK